MERERVGRRPVKGRWNMELEREERGEEYPGMLGHLRSLKAELLDEARWRVGSS
jgi:hypothetical protein